MYNGRMYGNRMVDWGVSMSVKEFISKVSKKGAGDRCIIVPRKELPHFKPGDFVMVRIMYKRGDNV